MNPNEIIDRVALRRTPGRVITLGKLSIRRQPWVEWGDLAKKMRENHAHARRLASGGYGQPTPTETLEKSFAQAIALYGTQADAAKTVARHLATLPDLDPKVRERAEKLLAALETPFRVCPRIIETVTGYYWRGKRRFPQIKRESDESRRVVRGRFLRAMVEQTGVRVPWNWKPEDGLTVSPAWVETASEQFTITDSEH